MLSSYLKLSVQSIISPSKQHNTKGRNRHAHSDHRTIKDFVRSDSWLLDCTEWQQHKDGVHWLQSESRVQADLPLLPALAVGENVCLGPSTRTTPISALQRAEILLSIVKRWQSHKTAVFFLFYPRKPAKRVVLGKEHVGRCALMLLLMSMQPTQQFKSTEDLIQ